MVYNCTLGMRGNVIVRSEDKKEREGVNIHAWMRRDQLRVALKG